MALTRSDLDLRLAKLEALVPRLLEDRDTFARQFEDQVEILLSEASKADQDYALAALEAIVDRSGFND